MKCRWCDADLEYGNGAWWIEGTCLSICEARPYDDPDDTHAPAVPDLHDPAAVEEWLQA